MLGLDVEWRPTHLVEDDNGRQSGGAAAAAGGGAGSGVCGSGKRGYSAGSSMICAFKIVVMVVVILL